MTDYMFHLDVTYDGPEFDDDSIDMLLQRLPGSAASMSQGVLGLTFTATGVDPAGAFAVGISLAAEVLAGLVGGWDFVGAEVRTYGDEGDR